ncbi:hypothetical protein [Fusibacter tunisiensis]|uniref:Uncharacterized protein n=1 Tax=Fusibacter tunisiensis TaxID=1008308 RepID=A0ABS2MS60_9FIRM|nr:hypothetical protein [Fusibacter tunisiensis]MBM7562230.1 hypothetical protein [Fusibacter tunisiensis]
MTSIQPCLYQTKNSNTFYQSICGGMLEPVCRTIELAHNKTHIEVTTLLIDGLNTDLNELHALYKWLAGIDPKIKGGIASSRNAIPPIFITASLFF